MIFADYLREKDFSQLVDNSCTSVSQINPESVNSSTKVKDTKNLV
jgi:hypothetical protein